MKLIRVFKRSDDGVSPWFRFKPGEIIDCEGFPPVFEYREVPDPDHQSSLDYFKGV
jgi:hypothetical protein